MKASQNHHAVVTILHLVLTAFTLISVCQSSPLSEQTTNPTSSSPLSKRAIGMICTGILPAGPHNYPPGLFNWHWDGLQEYCEQRHYGPNCACYPLLGGGAQPSVVRCVQTARNARFMRVTATDVCRQLCTCQDLPDRPPPEIERPRPNVLAPAAVGGLGRAGVR